jgi:hypothetical protein
VTPKYTRAARRARWNQRFRAAGDPLEHLKVAADFFRAAAKDAPPHMTRRALAGLPEALRRAACDLDTAMEKEEAR